MYHLNEIIKIFFKYYSRVLPYLQPLSLMKCTLQLCAAILSSIILKEIQVTAGYCNTFATLLLISRKPMLQPCVAILFSSILQKAHTSAMCCSTFYPYSGGSANYSCPHMYMNFIGITFYAFSFRTLFFYMCL